MAKFTKAIAIEELFLNFSLALHHPINFMITLTLTFTFRDLWMFFIKIIKLVMIISQVEVVAKGTIMVKLVVMLRLVVKYLISLDSIRKKSAFGLMGLIMGMEFIDRI